MPNLCPGASLGGLLLLAWRLESTATFSFRNWLRNTEIDEDQNSIVLRGFDGTDLTIPRKEIKTLKPVGRSLMPEGLLDGLDDAALRNLFAYLRISQPISK